jgi:hypothetical protein
MNGEISNAATDQQFKHSNIRARREGRLSATRGPSNSRFVSLRTLKRKLSDSYRVTLSYIPGCQTKDPPSDSATPRSIDVLVAKRIAPQPAPKAKPTPNPKHKGDKAADAKAKADREAVAAQAKADAAANAAAEAAAKAEKTNSDADKLAAANAKAAAAAAEKAAADAKATAASADKTALATPKSKNMPAATPKPGSTKGVRQICRSAFKTRPEKTGTVANLPGE